MNEIRRIGSQWKLEENSYYDMKNNGVSKHDVMAPIKYKLPPGNRLNVFKTMGHEKSINIDFMRNRCKYVMINHNT